MEKVTPTQHRELTAPQHRVLLFVKHHIASKRYPPHQFEKFRLAWGMHQNLVFMDL